MGIRFRWAGYRMPDEIGQKVDVKDVGHYVAMRGRMQYAYDKTQGQPATSQFKWNDATLFFSGPFGKHYSAFSSWNARPRMRWDWWRRSAACGAIRSPTAGCGPA